MASIVSKATVAKSRSRLLRQEAIDGYICILPWVLGFVLFTAGPMLASAALAFTEYDISFAPKFIALQNFKEMAQDDLFWKSLANTAFYTALYVPLHLAVALGVALALNVKLRGIGIFRTAFYIPSITPTVASAFLWMWLFNPDYGLANALLGLVGLPPSKWLFDEAMAKPSLILMALWAFGTAMLIFLAALQQVPETLYEAASIDGANARQRFVRITLPMITPVIFFNTVVSIIASFQIFTVAYVITNGTGSPNNATMFYVLYLYNQGFQYLHMGYASAMAWVLFAIIMLFTLVQLGLAKRWVYYEAETGA